MHENSKKQIHGAIFENELSGFEGEPILRFSQPPSGGMLAHFMIINSIGINTMDNIRNVQILSNFRMEFISVNVTEMLVISVNVTPLT